MEQLLHSPEGSLLTRGPGAYKIPSFNDVPAKFNVCLLRLYLIIIFVVLGVLVPGSLLISHNHDNSGEDDND